MANNFERKFYCASCQMGRIGPCSKSCLNSRFSDHVWACNVFKVWQMTHRGKTIRMAINFGWFSQSTFRFFYVKRFIILSNNKSLSILWQQKILTIFSELLPLPHYLNQRQMGGKWATLTHLKTPPTHLFTF